MSEEFMNECELDHIIMAESEPLTYQELLDNLYEKEVQYMFFKQAYEKQELELWLKTNWGEVFPDNKKPTLKDKEMYIKNELMEAKELRDTHKLNLDDFKRTYEIVLKYGIEVLE